MNKSDHSVNEGPNQTTPLNHDRSLYQRRPTIDILNELDPSERKLFTDIIRRLDKRINQGMTKLTWNSKG